MKCIRMRIFYEKYEFGRAPYRGRAIRASEQEYSFRIFGEDFCSLQGMKTDYSRSTL